MLSKPFLQSGACTYTGSWDGCSVSKRRIVGLFCLYSRSLLTHTNAPGIEKTHQRFRLWKFIFAFLADNLAMLTHPLCQILRLIQRLRGTNSPHKSFFLYLSDATWLPPPYRQLEDFQMYLCTLWGPALLSAFCYWGILQDTGNISAVEPLCPLLLYFLIGLIVATISAYEHRGLVMRRKYILEGESLSVTAGLPSYEHICEAGDAPGIHSRR